MPSTRGGVGVQAEVLTTGTRHTGLSIAVSGPTEVTYRRIVIQPGGSTGWHYHPGPVMAVIASGMLTRTFTDGSTEVSGPGDIVVEAIGPENAHIARNLGDHPTVLYVAYFVPEGCEHTIDIDAPSGGRPSPHRHEVDAFRRRPGSDPGEE